MKKQLVALAVTLSLATPALAAENSGTLVIAGGALSSATMDVYQAFADAAGNEKAKIGIVPAATGSINKKYLALQDIFAEFGVSKDNVVLLPLAVKNDKKTKEVDESTWSVNGSDIELANSIKDLNTIWFVGGDQTLITKVLLKDDGTDTPVLGSIREVYKKGGVIGGTSAGAAIMSETMIAGGNSTGALIEGFKNDYSSMNEQEYGPVVTSRGLNFFPYGTIDQHFDRKGRLGRLIVSLLEDSKQDFAYGVDEGTALVVKGDQASVVGTGGVTLVNTKDAQHTSGEYPIKASNIRLGYLQPGDTFSLSDHTYKSRPKSYTTVGHEYFEVPSQSVSGIMSSNRNLDEFIGFNLVDNKSASEVVSWALNEKQKGVRLVFSQDETTQGYWSQDITADVYSFENLKLDIDPVEIKISN